MTELFIKVLNLTISSSWLILAVLLFRFLLKKAPKWVSVILWGIVAIRLISPFSIESALSLIPSAEVVSPSVLIEAPVINTGFQGIDDAVNPEIADTMLETATEKSGNAMKILLRVSSRVWCVGVFLLLVYAVVSYLRLKRMVKTAVQYQDNIFQSEGAMSPFVLGILRPRIYLPFHISEESRIYVLAHEQAHIQRKDHWWKPIGFLLLTIHWFNPLMWLSYVLLCRDIELACDEKVVKRLGVDARANYSAALLSCSVNRRMISACPVAFGEVDVKTRVKSVLSYKKPAFWVVLIALILCIVVAVCFLTDPVDNDQEPDLSFLNYENAISLVFDRPEVVLIYYPVISNDTESFLNIATIPGSAVANYLDNCKWHEVNALRKAPSSSGSVDLVIADDYRITVYARKEQSVFNYAKVAYQDTIRYYRTGTSDYENAVQLIYSQERNGGWRFDITRDDVAKFRLYGPNFCGECVPEDGQTFPVGEVIWAGPLVGSTNRRDIFVSAIDKKGNILFEHCLHNYEFYATLLSIQDDYFVVEPVEGSWELNFFSTIEVPMQNMDPALEPERGDVLSIEYDGAVWESEMTRLHNVYSISVAKKGRDELKKQLDALKEQSD